MRSTLFIFLFAASLIAAAPSEEMVDAIKKGNAAALEILVKDRDDANSKIENGKTILMLATWEQKADIVSFLLAKGADINARDASGKTALMLAIWKENLAIVKILIKNGADKSVKNNEGLNASDIAELSGNGEIIDFLNTKN